MLNMTWVMTKQSLQGVGGGGGVWQQLALGRPRWSSRVNTRNEKRIGGRNKWIPAFQFYRWELSAEVKDAFLSFTLLASIVNFGSKMEHTTSALIAT